MALAAKLLRLIAATLLLTPAAAWALEPSEPTEDSASPPTSVEQTAEPSGAEANPFSMSWGASFASKYLWQGFDYSDGRAVFQPEVSVALRNVSVALWLNHDLETNQSDELDLYVQYDWSLGSAALATGYAYYEYPYREGWDPSQEIYLDMSYETVLNPSLSIHYDFDAGKGSYLTLGVAQGLDNPVQPVGLGMNLFYHSGYYDLSGFPSCEFNINVERAVGPVVLAPSISRFITWENGDYVGDNAVPGDWLFALNVGQNF